MTCGELKKRLEEYPDDATLVTIGCDSGGYDCEMQDEVFVQWVGQIAPEHTGKLFVGGNAQGCQWAWGYLWNIIKD